MGPSVVDGAVPGGSGPKRPIPLRPEEPAAEAVGRILARMAEVAESNVPGVLADRDPEPLHDLRVAVRRSRSLLGQVRKVFAGRRLAPFERELRWLGTVTGPCRDLDILLRDLGSRRGILDGEAVAGLEELLRRAADERRREHRTLARRLESRRFAAAMERWRGFAARAATPGLAGPRAGEPVLPLAGERILRAHRRLIRHGKGLGEDPPPEALHRLRIDAKKLRYLLELFASLYPAQALRSLIGELKGIQDLLGEHNDAAVQLRWLAVQAGRLPAGMGAARAAVERLEGLLRRRQEELRHGFSRRFAALARPTSRHAYERLFGPDA